MKMSQSRIGRKIAIFAFFLGTTGGAASGGELSLSGDISWNRSGNSVNIAASRVSNDLDYRTGSLRLQLWATATPYPGGSISGYILGTRPLDPLPAGYYYSDISGNVSFHAPPAGLYYTTVTLEEYDNGWVIVDYVTFQGQSNFGGSAPDPSGSDLDLSGSLSWKLRDNQIDIRAGRVSNQSNGRSGSLRLKIWATKTPYTGGRISGYVLGTRSLPTLAGNSSYTKIAGYVKYQPPPRGRYFTTMTLEEYRGSWIIVDFFTFPTSTKF